MRYGLFVRLLRYVECCAAHVCSAYTALLEFSNPWTRTKILIPCLVSGLMLSGCGYHLVGQGDGSGAIPADVVTVSIRSSGSTAQALASRLKRQLESGASYSFVDAGSVSDAATHAEIRIENASESFVPSAYDRSGIASQYRMTLHAGIRVFRSGEAIWDSGVLSFAGDVYVAGGPAGIEASRERIRADLQKEWVRSAAGRIRSGF